MEPYKEEFGRTDKPHILMITNHGVHQWKVVPGLPDTGGQNVFVNQFTEALSKVGYKITIVNRGGYPHPVSRDPQTGVHYKDGSQRILYLEDGLPEFVRKEDMDERIPALVDNLAVQLAGEKVDLIISHYWDGAKLGFLFNQRLDTPVVHVWVPHSLGAVKKRNVNPDRWEGLRIDERIRNEHDIIAQVDFAAATSATIRASLVEDYRYAKEPLFLPPCINPERYYPREIKDDHPIWDFLAGHTDLSPAEVRSRKIITEISRTDTTKRKDILIQAFAKIQPEHPDTLLVVTIDVNQAPVGPDLLDLIRSEGVAGSVAVLGSVWDQLPDIYAVTDIYCMPSIMEGFGMAPQEAAATRAPVISSNLVPYVVEYLLGSEVTKIDYGEGDARQLQLGAGAIVVPADDVAGFAHALGMLLADGSLRVKMGEWAYTATIPYFTWGNMVRVFLEAISA
jgi:glycosyltransferase involved in cell wall biosynthesis